MKGVGDQDAGWMDKPGEERSGKEVSGLEKAREMAKKAFREKEMEKGEKVCNCRCC